MKIIKRHRSPFHRSDHEEKHGWIPLKTKHPPNGTTVKVCRIRMLDWNLETMEWMGTGKFFANGTWTITCNLKKTAYMSSPAGTDPTHWKKMKYKLKKK